MGGREHVFLCAPGETLLDAALDAGVSAPYSCHEGHCGACIVKQVEGSVHMQDALALSRRDKSRGFILACSAFPTAAEIILDYED